MTNREHSTVKEIDLQSAQGVVTCEIDDNSTARVDTGEYLLRMGDELDRLDVAEVCCED